MSFFVDNKTEIFRVMLAVVVMWTTSQTLKVIDDATKCSQVDPKTRKSLQLMNRVAFVMALLFAGATVWLWVGDYRQTKGSATRGHSYLQQLLRSGKGKVAAPASA